MPSSPGCDYDRNTLKNKSPGQIPAEMMASIEEFGPMEVFGRNWIFKYELFYH